MDLRKRHMVSEDDMGPAPKKRIISAGGSSTTKVNSVSNTANSDGMDEDEPQRDDLERFRKEAIFRRMKHYSRAYEQTQRRVEQLEKRSTAGDAALASTEACWKHLVSQIQTLLPKGLPPLDAKALEIYDLASSSISKLGEDEPTIMTQYHESLKEMSRSTQGLIAAFVKLAPNSPSVQYEELRNRTRQAETRVAKLEPESTLLRSQLTRVQQELEDCKEQLALTQNKVERARSETVVALEKHIGLRSSDATEAPKEEMSDVRPSPHATFVASPSPGDRVVNGHSDSSAEEEWRIVAVKREEAIKQLLSEKVELENTIANLRLELSSPSEDTVKSAPPYKALSLQVAELKMVADTSKERASKLSAEVTDLRTTRSKFESQIEMEGSKKLEQLNTLVQKQGAEITRLRSARDVALAENRERVVKESEKLATLNELKTLNKANAQYISVLRADAKRMKTRLASATGNQDLVAFILGSDGDAKYVDDLQARLKEAQSRAQALEATLSRLDTKSPDMARLLRSEADARQAYAKTCEALDKYERVYGSGSASKLSGEASELKALLSQKDEDIQSMKLKQQTAESETETLLNEMEDMQQAYINLEKQCKNKIFDLSAAEERIVKLRDEKAKLEHKYFTCMKARQSVEMAKRTEAQKHEKESTLAEKLIESDKAYAGRVASLEKELNSSRLLVEKYLEEALKYQQDYNNVQVQLDGEAKKVTVLQEELHERQKVAHDIREEARKLDEENGRLRKETVRASKASRTSVKDATQRELELLSENDKLFRLLRCSCCAKEFRSHVLVKCMHTFCKGCLDARITTRQRKCPACQMSFAVSDVQALYLQ